MHSIYTLDINFHSISMDLVCANMNIDSIR